MIILDAKFKTDFYRMTGIPFKKSFTCLKLLLMQHNLKYMYWWRKVVEKKGGLVSLFFLYLLSRKYGLEISRDAMIDSGLYLGHPYNITVAGGAVIGKNVNLHKGCTIGRENRGKREGMPVLGNNIYVGINATIIGNIKIGDDVLIAPNAFVNFDVPNHSVVVGNPGKIISKNNATHSYVNYCV